MLFLSFLVIAEGLRFGERHGISLRASEVSSGEKWYQAAGAAGGSADITYANTFKGYLLGMKDSFFQRQYTKGLGGSGASPRYDTSDDGRMLSNFVVGFFWFENLWCCGDSHYNENGQVNAFRYSQGARNWFVVTAPDYNWCATGCGSWSSNSACRFNNCLRLGGWQTWSLSFFMRLTAVGMVPYLITSITGNNVATCLYYGYGGLFVLTNVADDLCVNCRPSTWDFVMPNSILNLFTDYCIIVGIVAKVGLLAAGVALAGVTPAVASGAAMGAFYLRNLIDFFSDDVGFSCDLVWGCLCPWQETAPNAYFEGAERCRLFIQVVIILGIALAFGILVN